MMPEQRPNHAMSRVTLSFQERIEDRWYDAIQEGIAFSHGNVYVDHYILSYIDENGVKRYEDDTDENRAETFSSFQRLIRVYYDRPYVRNIVPHWIDEQPMLTKNIQGKA